MGHNQWKDVGLNLATAFLETEAEDGEYFVTLFHLLCCVYIEALSEDTLLNGQTAHYKSEVTDSEDHAQMLSEYRVFRAK